MNKVYAVIQKSTFEYEGTDTDILWVTEDKDYAREMVKEYQKNNQSGFSPKVEFEYKALDVIKKPT